MTSLNRRSFLEFLGKGTVGIAMLPPLLNSCSETQAATPFSITPLAPSPVDDLLLAEGLQYDVLIRWNEEIAPGKVFGFNNDFTCFLPFDKDNPKDGILWVNHEYVDSRYVTGVGYGPEAMASKTKEQADIEIEAVGGSLLRVRKQNGTWSFVPGDQYNRRVSGHARIPFNWDEPIQGATEAMGTLANCSGGLLPNGNILTCEENYDQFYGERNLETGALITHDFDLGWYNFYQNPPEHYGWVVEVNPKTGEAQKHIALGRCAHECATVHELEDGRLVVYSGDDANDQCLYKFVGSKPGSLKEGMLYVAVLESGRWEALDHSRPELKEKFESQTEVLVRLRQSAKAVGGTPLNRPEDIEIDPLTGHVLISLTNNKPKGDYFGSILKIEEDGGTYDAMTFQSETYLAGGEETGFACPDNMAFDPRGNLWFTSDISGSNLNAAPYSSFGNNGLYVVPRSGEQAGQVIQIASAPVHAELTGPWFSPDGKTLFLSVQHPGEASTDINNPSSHWPDGGESTPRPSVVTIQGELLNQLCAI